MPRCFSPRVIPATLAVLACTLSHAADSSSRVQAIRFWSFGDVTRIAIQTEGPYTLVTDQIAKPARAYFDLAGIRPPAAPHRGIQVIPVNDQRVRQIRVAEVSPGKTRIVLDLVDVAEITSSQLVNPDRLMVEVRPKTAQPGPVSVARSYTASKRIDLTKTPNDSQATTQAVLDGIPTPATLPANTPENSHSEAPMKAGSTPEPLHVPDAPVRTEKQPTATTKTQPKPPDGVAAPAQRPTTGSQSLVRIFGLKLGKVVIDPGHGGHDTGTIGPNGLMEKDLVLDVALRLGKLIGQQLGAQVIYTRANDTFIPLEERTKLANKERADLFISIHANSSPEPRATGVETYFFNFTSDRTSLDLATRENATSTSSISDLNDLLHAAVLNAKLAESREFAQKVQASLWATSVRMNGKSRDRGVRQAPFVVLIGATMPSILAEIGFVSNPHDEKLLQRPDQRQKFAEALCKGVSQYAKTLSHMDIARASSE